MTPAPAMEEFLNFILKRLVGHPEDAVLTTAEFPNKTVIKLQLRRSDVPRVIGKRGQTIEAIRHLLMAAGAKHHRKVFLQIPE